MADSKDKILIDLEIDDSDLQKSIVSINSLTKANKELNAEKRNLNINDVEQKKRIDEINAAVDRNNKTIKENSSALEQNRLNVGNYKKDIQDALPNIDKFSGGLGSSAQGFGAMTKQALAFIATPIGAVVAILGAAIGALTAYINGSDEAGDRFAKTTAALGLVFEKLKVIVENVGGFIFDTIEFIAGGVEKVIGFVNPALGATIEAAKKAGEELADLQNKIEDEENASIVRRAEVNAKVQALREKAITQEGDLKRKTIQEAINLEKGLAETETSLAQERLKAFDIENKSRLESNKLATEQIKQRAELVADVINQQSAGAQATIKFQKELERLRDQEIADNRKALDQKAKDEADFYKIRQDLRFQDSLGQQNSFDANKEFDNLTSESHEQTEQEGLDAIQRELDAENKAADEKYKIDQNSLKRKQELDKEKLASEKATQNGIAGVLTLSVAFAKSVFGENKLTASLEAAVNTYKAANVALASFPPPFNAIAAGLTIATGLVNVAKINDVKFAEGGRVNQLGNGVKFGTVGGRSHAEGGTKYYGSDGNVVEFERGEGFFVAKVDAHQEFLSNMSSLNMKHGGRPWTGRAPVASFALGGQVSEIQKGTFQDSYQIEQLALLLNSQRTVAIVEEIDAKSMERSTRVNRAQVI